jgi:ABC-type enterobactin transport system permease subunit
LVGVNVLMTFTAIQAFIQRQPDVKLGMTVKEWLTANINDYDWEGYTEADKASLKKFLADLIEYHKVLERRAT